MKIATRTDTTLRLRKIKDTDESAFLKLAKVDRAFHLPWIFVPHRKKSFAAYVEHMREKDNRAYVVIRKDTNEIVGVVELRDIYLGDFSNAYACWYAFANQTGHGFMRTALQEVIQIAFNKLRLHRLEANIQPENKPSIILAKACGFKKEGFSPKFLRKNGEWRDHERWAILNPND